VRNAVQLWQYLNVLLMIPPAEKNVHTCEVTDFLLVAPFNADKYASAR
jgi:hypothetical protein